MALREKLKWDGDVNARLATVQKSLKEISSGEAKDVTYYWHVGACVFYALETCLDDHREASINAAKNVVEAALLYFYGEWRERLPNRSGQSGHEVWRKDCLWYEEVHQSLPFAVAICDWSAMKRIAEYPPEDHLPAVDKARGETAWSWAIINFIRDGASPKVETYLQKAESDKAKRPQLLALVLRALIKNDAVEFEKTLLAYLAYYRKSEFKLQLTKLVSLDGTTLYHLGRKQGFRVELPENLADYVICFE